MQVQAIGLFKSYYLENREVPVLKNVNLHLQAGEFVSLTGPSGVGKSTLLHLLGTLDAPSDGKVLFDSKNVFGWSGPRLAQFRNEFMGFVFQFHHLLPELSALENVMMPLLVRRLSSNDARARASQMLERVGLEHRLNHRPGELSGGEQQRVAVARALVNKPRMLLADEPTGNLDEDTGAAIIDIVQQISKQEQVTVLMVTHNTRLAQMAQRQLHLTKEGLS